TAFLLRHFCMVGRGSSGRSFTRLSTNVQVTTMSLLPRRFATILIAAAGLAGASAVHAQGVQVLDSVDGYSTSSVLGMGFRDPLPRIDFQQLEVGVTSVVACQRAITQGLYCIDGPILRFWPNTKYLVAGVIPD